MSPRASAGGRRAVAACVLAWAIVGGACQNRPRPELDGLEAAPASAALPTYDAIAQAHNARVERLEFVAANVDADVDRPRDGVGRESFHAEAYVQVIRPRRLYLKITKVSEPLYFLGSNDQAYWWLDLTGRERVGLVGRHELASARTTERFGLPIHPPALIHLMALEPLPEPGSREAPTVSWAPGRRGVALAFPGSSERGAFRMVLDAASLLPRRVILDDARGKAVVWSALDRFESVGVVGDARARASFPASVAVTIVPTDTTVGLRLNSIENPGLGRAREANFDLEKLARAYGVEAFVDLDRPAPDRRQGAGGPDQRP